MGIISDDMVVYEIKGRYCLVKHSCRDLTCLRNSIANPFLRYLSSTATTTSTSKKTSFSDDREQENVLKLMNHRTKETKKKNTNLPRWTEWLMYPELGVFLPVNISQKLFLPHQSLVQSLIHKKQSMHASF